MAMAGEATRNSESATSGKSGSAPFIWAIDPFERKAKSIQNISKAIDLFAVARNTGVLPVSVVATSDLNWPMPVLLSIKKQPAALAKQAINALVTKVSGETRMPPMIVLQPKSSRLEAAKKILQLATKNNAPLIAVNTRQTDGGNLLRMGSFAETLIAISKIPVLATNPKSKVSNRISRILFPSDLSPRSMRAFKTFLKWAKAFDAEVTLLTVLDTSYQSLAFGGEWGMGLDAALVERAFKDSEDSRRRHGKSWQAIAKRAGVRCAFEMVKGPQSIGDAILRFSASTDFDLIAMATYRGRIEQAILGSVARDVLTGATRPVLVVNTARA